MKTLIPLLLLITSCTALSSNMEIFPKSICSTEMLQLKLVDLSFCALKDDINKIYFLGLASHTIVILSNDKELTIGLNPPSVAISDLHKKFNITVHEFFLSLSNNTLKTEKLSVIKKAFDINESNTMNVYRKDDLFAFTITGSNVGYDRVYLNKVGSDVIYQITGEFDNHELLEILSRIEY